MSDTMRPMRRRTFLGMAAAAVTHLAAGPVAGQAQQAEAVATAKEGNPVAKRRHWMHGFGGDDPRAVAEALNKAGFDVVVAGGQAVIEAVNEADMDSWLCGGAFGLGDLRDDDRCKALDVTGQPRIWFNSGCPNNLVLRDRNLKAYENMAATPHIKGILVDGCRFASPASGLGAFLTCFDDSCQNKATALGFDFEQMRRAVKALHDTLTGEGGGQARRGLAWLARPCGVVEWLTQNAGILEWLRFRRACITEHFRAISEIIHGAGLCMGVYIFAPSLAPLVGQSYVDLREFVDVFAPMIYRNYPERPGIACLNWELTIIPEELGLAGHGDEAQVMHLILSWSGLVPAVSERTIASVQAGLPPEVVGHETALARSLLGKSKMLVPIIYIDDPLMARTAKLVRANGADGINFFAYRDNWQELVRPTVSR